MDNLHVLHLINAGPAAPLAALAGNRQRMLIYLSLIGIVAAWIRANAKGRAELLELLLAAGLALTLAQLVAHVWPQPPRRLHWPAR